MYFDNLQGLLKIEVIGQRSRSRGFLCVSCVHDIQLEPVSMNSQNDFSFIIQYWSFIFALSYYTVLLFVIWAVVSAVAAFLALGTHVLLFCSVFSDIVRFCVSKIN